MTAVTERAEVVPVTGAQAYEASRPFPIAVVPYQLVTGLWPDRSEWLIVRPGIRA